MITLKTLKYATKQEVFDQVAEHLLNQNKQSLDPDKYNDICVYRAPGGLKCAVGCLIADDEYLKEWEGKGWGIIGPNIALDLGIDYNREHEYLLITLQNIHDNFDTAMWLDRLKGLAKAEELNTKTLEKHERRLQHNSCG